MVFKGKEIQYKEIWENFLLGCQGKTFLSSWNWGEFQKRMGNKIWRLGVFNGNELLSLALIIKIQAKRGTFLLVPHGPNTKLKVKTTYPPAKGGAPREKLKVLTVFLEELKKIAKREDASFIRINPIWERSQENIRVFKELGFRDAPIHIHPELTWELNITPSEEKLLMNMRKTTRYLIRKAQKNKEIKISQNQKLGDIEIFNTLYQEVVDRQHFIPFSLDYLKNEFSAFNSDNQISIFLGKYRDELIASGIFIFWSGMGFYHHGATSLKKYPKIPVSYLLQWEAIREAKKRGCHTFNFWGITSEESKSHPWAGLTLFKKGFGGYKKEYVRTQDFPLGGGWMSSKKYWLTYLFEKLRKTKRGF